MKLIIKRNSEFKLMSTLQSHKTIYYRKQSSFIYITCVVTRNPMSLNKDDSNLSKSLSGCCFIVALLISRT